MDDPHRPLREDVKLLGDLLGETLRRQEGTELFEAVETVRALSKRARQGSAEAFAELGELLRSMPLERLTPLVRAFSHFLSLANLAEQHHRMRRRRDYLRGGAGSQRGSIDDVLGRLREGGMSEQSLHQAIGAIDVELVLTAHPTEAVRRAIRLKHRRIDAELRRLDRNDLGGDEREESRREIHRQILGSWATAEVRARRPTPIEEVEWGLGIFEQILWDAVPRWCRSLDRSLRRHVGRGLPPGAAPIRFGSWMGGDRDGNPRVTSEVTARATWLARWMAADLYLREVEALRLDLSMEAASPELRDRVAGAALPYRELLRGVTDRLRRARRDLADTLSGTEPGSSERVVRREELAEPLELIRRSLESVGLGEVAAGRLADLEWRLQCFGLTLVRLDLRQDAALHATALDAITRDSGLGSYASWDEQQRLAFLRRELDGCRPLLRPALLESPHLDDGVRDVLSTLRTVAALPRDSFGAHVISMARSASDVLALELLQREAGLEPGLRVVPLFETLEDLNGAGRELRTLLGERGYRQRLESGEGCQEVMIGYSDSGKDAGRLAAAWALYRAQEDLVEAARDAAVPLVLFHGRGGTVGRGGGPVPLAIRSQPPHCVTGRLRVTEQGEMIQERFGLPGIALRTLDEYAAATLEAAAGTAIEPRPEWRARMQRLADRAEEEYRDVIGDPRFVEYFRAATPERELAGLNIGSRPARRAGPGGGLESLRAIPWVFAWTQSRLLLPAWLGTGAALAAAIEEPHGALAELRQMQAEWPFFRATMELTAMALASADRDIAAQYDTHLVPETLRPLGEDLRRRLEAAREAVRVVTGRAELLAENPVIQRSIEVRNPYVDPIHLAQVQILRRLRAAEPGSAEAEELRRALLLTIAGIAAGMRGTG